MKAWWESISEREQKLVSIGGGALLLAIFYWGLWQPVSNAKIDNEKKLLDQQSTNVWAKGAIARLKSAANNNARGNGSLQQIVNNSSRQYNIQIGRMNPKGEQLNLLIDETVFNDLLRWVNHLEQNQGLKVMNMDIQQLEEPGKVRVSRLLIEKS